MEIVGLVGLQAEGNISIWSCLGFGVLRAFLVYGDFALYWGLIVAVTMLSFALVDSRRGCLSQILIYRDIELVFMQDQAKKKDQPAEAQIACSGTTLGVVVVQSELRPLIFLALKEKVCTLCLTRLDSPYAGSVAGLKITEPDADEIFLAMPTTIVHEVLVLTLLNLTTTTIT
eukprot:3384366-Amphidinium_carterae.1